MTPRALTIAGVVAGLLIPAASAPANSARVDGDTLYVDGTAAPETIWVSKGNAAGTLWEITSHHSTPVAGTGCVVSRLTVLTCTSVGVTRIVSDAGAGNDTFKVSNTIAPGFLAVTLGEGNDSYQDDRVHGAAAVNFGPGNDLGGYSGGYHLTGAVELDGGLGDDSIDGGEDDDVLIGGAGDDIVQGWGGGDRIDAGAGADVVEGDGGDDTIAGGDGDDALGAGAGNDTVTGGTGRDRLGTDHDLGLLDWESSSFPPQAPAGDDTVYARDGEPDEVRCGGGNDFAEIDDQDHSPSNVDPACESIDEEPTDGTPPPSSPPAGSPGASSGPTPPPGSPSLIVRDVTKVVQRLAVALGRGVTASLTTSSAGTWRMRLLSKSGKRLGSTMKRVPGAGSFRARVRLNSAARERLRRAHRARVTLRSTFTDIQGRRATTTRRLKLRR